MEVERDVTHGALNTHRHGGASGAVVGGQGAGGRDDLVVGRAGQRAVHVMDDAFGLPLESDLHVIRSVTRWMAWIQGANSSVLLSYFDNKRRQQSHTGDSHCLQAHYMYNVYILVYRLLTAF